VFEQICMNMLQFELKELILLYDLLS